jgi:hypothetical protein
VAIVAILWLIRVLGPLVGIGAGAELMVRILGGYVGVLAVLTWWLFFSRAQWPERFAVLAAMIVALAAAAALGHRSMVVWLLWYAAPVLSTALVAGAVVARGLGDRFRPQVMAAGIILTCAATLLFRVDGVAGHGVAAFDWRWTETADQRLLALADEPPGGALRERLDAAPAAPVKPAPAGGAEASAADAVTTAPSKTAAPVVPVPSSVRWAGFRGAGRDGIVRGVRIATDWATTPPVLLWPRPIGPGWALTELARGDRHTRQHLVD